jgi:hypothetical protein
MLLRPYSLGHELWLVREHNSVLRGSSDGLPAAVLICCQTWTELKRMRSDPLLRFKLWLWHRRVALLTKTFCPPNTPNTGNSFFKTELAKFIDYRNEGLLEFRLSEIPKADSGSPARLPGTPFVLRLQQWLMHHFQLKEAAAWDYPAGLAKMRWATHWESQGGMEIYNAHEAEFDQFIAEQRAKKKTKSTTDKHG